MPRELPFMLAMESARKSSPPPLRSWPRCRTGVGGFALTFEPHDAGAVYYRETGRDISDEAFAAAGAADAILLGAMGLPDVRHDDGTEIAPHLRMREAYHLVAGVRPVKAYPNTPCRLSDPRAADIDFIVLRESTEGLFYSRQRGEIIDDKVAYETLRISRDVTEQLCDAAFSLARQRKERGGKGRVTCVDKSNVFRSFAFFRKIFYERAAKFPDIQADDAYVDAMALDLIRKPWDYDVLVMENMFADILSDLGGGLVGGMGMAPCAETWHRTRLVPASPRLRSRHCRPGQGKPDGDHFVRRPHARLARSPPRQCQDD